MNNKLLSAVVFLIFPQALHAQGSQQWQPGLKGELSLLAGYTQSKSQFNSQYKQTESLGAATERKGKAMAMPFFSAQYTFDSLKDQVYIGTDRADIALGRFHTQIGYRHSLESNGVLSASFIPGILPNKTWEDPFLTGQERTETDTSVRALRFKYDNIFSSGFSLELATGQQKIDNEKSAQSILIAQEQKTLDRNGTIYFAEGSYRFPLSRQYFLRAALNHAQLNADGSAMSFSANAFEAGLFVRGQRSSAVINLNYQLHRFDENNPIFDKDRKDNSWGAFVAYSYEEPFGWQDWEFVSLSGYNSKNSSIDFYDENSLMISTGMTYNF